MKKLLFLVAAAAFSGSLFAGGLLTNTNQSASWVRMPSQDASTGIEAVYFNPAGLMKLTNGLHFSISNQFISQKKEVENFYAGPGAVYGLNQSMYEGKVSAPIFPSIYAAYKMDKLAFSFGFNPIGGGGGATFDKGLPSFEMSASDLVPALASTGVNAYNLNAYFEGTSVYFGYQAGISYKINDMISIFGGVRYVTAKNTYSGYLKDIEVFNFMGNNDWMRADVILGSFAESANNAVAAMQPIIDAGIGSLTFDQAEGMSYIDAATRAQLEGGLLQFGIDPTGLTLEQAQGAYAATATGYAAKASLLGDQEADVEQTGTGITPIIGLNISPSEKLNIGIKYEFATKIELTNKTTKDFTTGFTPEGIPVTMFPDGAKLRSDMPAMLSAGLRYKASSRLNVSLGGHYYYDLKADYGKTMDGESVTNDKVIDNNYFEVAGGLEYMLSQKLLVSAGYLLAKTGVNDNYQSDLSYSLTSSTVGVGGKYSLNDKVGINLGVGYTIYQDGEKNVEHNFNGTMLNARETYYKNNLFVGIGVDLSF